ncbi:MAG TPA: hypothetical protein VN886_02355 [Acidimicrobiales bacterium]|nr:hypothetical protein [Acidimicrobiales bacterium]
MTKTEARPTDRYAGIRPELLTDPVRAALEDYAGAARYDDEAAEAVRAAELALAEAERARDVSAATEAAYRLGTARRVAQRAEPAISHEGGIAFRAALKAGWDAHRHAVEVSPSDREAQAEHGRLRAVGVALRPEIDAFAQDPEHCGTAPDDLLRRLSTLLDRDDVYAAGLGSRPVEICGVNPPDPLPTTWPRPTPGGGRW